MSRPAPPFYSQLSGIPATQLLIVPSSNSFQFQNGYLGVDETSSVEGEVHVKGALPGMWNRLTISLVSVERSPIDTVQLASHTLELFNALPLSTPGTSSNPAASPPTTSHFSILLLNDTPQPVRTPHSSLSHQLVATLYPSDHSEQPLVTAQDIDIKRYSPDDRSLTPLVPRTYTLESPSRIEIQVSRLSYRLGEIIPVYVTIPVPDMDRIAESRTRLRNIMVELVRTTRMASHHSPNHSDDTGTASKSISTCGTDHAASENIVINGGTASTSSISPKSAEGNGFTDSIDVLLPLGSPTVFRTPLTRSGASARFHSTRPVRVRLLIRASELPSSPVQMASDTPSGTNGFYDCTITQHTTLHSVDFTLEISVNFLNQSTERSDSSSQPVQHAAKVTIPITLLPPLAKKGEQTGDTDIERAYHKKFDKPPTQTNRMVEADLGPPGPSISGAPPPFDERDAPPPPFAQSDPQSMQAGSSRLPTFLESEAHYVLPMSGPSNLQHSPYGGYTPGDIPQESQQTSATEDPDSILELEGEGRLFGFRPEEQFDGLEASFGSGAEPPPAIENVQEDTDVTALADLVDRPERALEAIGRGLGVATTVDPTFRGRREDEDELDHLEHALRLNDDAEAPAPPFTDDPSDPPPGIDVEYRTSPPPFPPPSSDAALIDAQVSPVDMPPSIEEVALHSTIPTQEMGNLSSQPPPYLNTAPPQGDNQHRPPPYVDLRTAHDPEAP
ncbi:hypothetical protein FRC17_000819 [Serendipita sp. 399]|nr:hypothetical protein FRC17_000819 [Serendipita sp. 399]